MSEQLHRPRRLDIGCGQRKTAGFTGIDLHPPEDTDIAHDLFSFPWPIADNAVSEVHCAHFVEHIPHYIVGCDPRTDGWELFFLELYRICKPNAKVRVVHPYAGSDRAFWDPTHTRYIEIATWNYLSKLWRDRELLDHYTPDYDFEVVTIGLNGIPDDVVNRGPEFQQFALARYRNVIEDLDVLLKVKKKAPPRKRKAKA